MFIFSLTHTTLVDTPDCINGAVSTVSEKKQERGREMVEEERNKGENEGRIFLPYD